SWVSDVTAHAWPSQPWEWSHRRPVPSPKFLLKRQPQSQSRKPDISCDTAASFRSPDGFMTASTASAFAPRERILTFAGSCNFRDIGGYQTRHGASVRWGRVYRSGVLSYFTREDEARLTE